MRRQFLLGEIILCLFAEHEVVVIFGDEPLDLSVFAIIELKEGKELAQHVRV